jgi:hypothetical protein
MVGVFSDGSALPMVSVMALCSFAAITALALGRRVITNKIRNADMQEETLEMIEKT